MRTLHLIILLLFFGCDAHIKTLISERNLIKGINLSKQTKKPILVHFTGHACVGYDEFIYDLATSKTIQKKLNEEFVTIQLYVDDKTKLQLNDTLQSTILGLSNEGLKKLSNARTVGHLNSAIQIDWLNNNLQPFYTNYVHNYH